METTGKAVKTKWNLDQSHTEIGFKVKHLMLTDVKGRFSKCHGDIYTLNDDMSSMTASLQIDASSITTGNDVRDNNLKGADFLDVENFRTIFFVTSRFVRNNGDKYALHGELTVKSITRPVKLDIEFGGIVTDPWGSTRAGYVVSGKINRTDFGLTWNALLEGGGVMVGDEVFISCEVEITKAP